MSKPESIKVEPWAEFSRQSYSLITDDFVHDKPYTLKVNAKTEKATVQIKETVNYEKGFKVADEIKLWFSLPSGGSFYSKIKSSNYLKLSYDHGTSKFFQRNWNLYATVNASKTLENLSLRLGAAHLSEKCNSDNRIKIAKKEEEYELTWYNRTIVKHNKFTFGFVGAYEITKNLISKNNLLFGYQVNDKTQVFLRAEVQKFRASPIALAEWKNYFSHFKVDVISKIDANTKVGVEATFHLKDKPIKDAQVVVERVFPEQKLTTKVSVNSKLDLSLLLKHPSLIAKDLGKISVGIHGSNLINEKRAFKFGVQSEFNV